MNGSHVLRVVLTFMEPSTWANHSLKIRLMGLWASCRFHNVTDIPSFCQDFPRHNSSQQCQIDVLTRLSSQPTLCSFNDFVTSGQISRKYCSALHQISMNGAQLLSGVEVKRSSIDSLVLYLCIWETGLRRSFPQAFLWGCHSCQKGLSSSGRYCRCPRASLFYAACWEEGQSCAGDW